MKRLVSAMAAVVLNLATGGVVRASDGPQELADKSAPAPANVRFNKRVLSERGRAIAAQIEQAYGVQLDGEYWYDPRTGAAGRWGGPAVVILPVGLELGGPLPADASGGGDGRLTGVFVNGRELHPVDVAGLTQLVGPVPPGRWWLDANGNYGPEGGPAMGNLMAASQARRGQGAPRAWSSSYQGSTARDNMNVASDGSTTCVSVSGYSSCTGN